MCLPVEIRPTVRVRSWGWTRILRGAVVHSLPWATGRARARRSEERDKASVRPWLGDSDSRAVAASAARARLMLAEWDADGAADRNPLRVTPEPTTAAVATRATAPVRNTRLTSEPLRRGYKPRACWA